MNSRVRASTPLRYVFNVKRWVTIKLILNLNFLYNKPFFVISVYNKFIKLIKNLDKYFSFTAGNKTSPYAY